MKSILLVAALILPLVMVAQHNHHARPTDTSVTHSHRHNSLSNKIQDRIGSGTGWLPDSTPKEALMLHTDKWMWMLHGNIFLRYTKTDVFKSGSRGSEKADAVNWFMGMGQRRLGSKGTLRLTTMLSLDPLFGGEGYPLLFQTGESWRREPLVDRQHPHDLFSELSMKYSHRLGKKTVVFFYTGLPGEPALGSVAFMHRHSALFGPDAPLSHHWNDGTHITFGVMTAGIESGRLKLDLSGFSGREPDEFRYNLDRPKLNSYSGRVAFNPNPYWSLQVSGGYIASPEILRPQENVRRTTASIIYAHPMSRKRHLDVVAIWGLNNSHAPENAFLFEGAYQWKRWSVYTRYEFVQKSVDELALEENVFEHDALFGIHALSFGFNRELIRAGGMRIACGGQTSIYTPDTRLEFLYGLNPVSAQVFLRVYPRTL